MESASGRSAAASKPQSLSPSPPTAQPDPDADRPPKAMTTAEVEAVIAALPAKKDALREAFHRLVACSPFPLPFTWDDLDAHISSLQSAIALRSLQLRVLDAARPVSAPATIGGDEKGKNQGEDETSEEEEEELVEEEVQETGEDEEDDDEKDDEEKEEVVEEEYEEVEVVEEYEEEVEEYEEVEVEEEYEEVEVVEEYEEEVEVEEEYEEVEVEEEYEEEEVEEEEEVMDANNAADKEKNADTEMQEEEEVMDANKAADKEKNADTEMQEEEEVKMEEQEELKVIEEVDDKEQKNGNVGKGKEEQESGEEMGKAVEEQQEAKKVSREQYIKEQTGEPKIVSSKEADLPLQGVDKDLMAACATMDSTSLVEFVCKIGRRQEYHLAMRHAQDAAALALRVVRGFLLKKQTKNNNVWENCVQLIRCVPEQSPEFSMSTIEQAKQLAKDWKNMIDKPENCGDLGILASWALLYFLISYNIVSEFGVDEIIRLFGTVPRKYQRRKCFELCKDLGLVSRISDLIGYLIANGQQLSVIQLVHALDLVDEYPPLPLLEGYVEKAKGTALELLSKNASHKNPAVSKEIQSLRVAHTMLKQHTDSSQSVAILAEIDSLLAGYANKRSLINASTALTSNSWQQKETQQKQRQEQKPCDEGMKQNQENKKRKNEKQHEGQDSQLQGKKEKLQRKQEQRKQHKLQENKGQQPHKPRTQQRQRQRQPQPQHLYQPRPWVSAPGVLQPVVPHVAQFGPIGYGPAVMPGVQDAPFPVNFGVQFNPYQLNPIYHYPAFYPR
ncbi:uncharacterized protein LOC100822902 [Brachypodium distachyon]|uniref:FRIGIDA-like protein n=1 Tax=Brachypodium distachyon TaxID=15368 RepID=A0A0Q3KT89_BRADI|nr:uncharacterized protein LOC100822902 [Brachypodium distachyon]KQK14305.1 hypothetical protein BRADI_1g15317v3 [Brachypodium distachyon]|eukprot:XP_010232985.1 uncharacterized protein LOC100822902 [Brachypodium distachyon]